MHLSPVPYSPQVPHVPRVAATSAKPPSRPAGLAVVGAPVLELRRVVRSWRAGAHGCQAQVRALAGVDLAVAPAELLALCGPRASGKTTLLLCAAGIIRPDAGLVLGAAPGRVAYVGPGDGDWARRAMSAVERGARALLLDVLDGPSRASPRAVAALAGSVAGAGLAVVVAAREPDALPAFAARLVELRDGRVVAERAVPVAGRAFVARRLSRL